MYTNNFSPAKCEYVSLKKKYHVYFLPDRVYSMLSYDILSIFFSIKYQIYMRSMFITFLVCKVLHYTELSSVCYSRKHLLNIFNYLVIVIYRMVYALRIP
jgi:hypothetical protein